MGQLSEFESILRTYSSEIVRYARIFLWQLSDLCVNSPKLSPRVAVSHKMVVVNRLGARAGALYYNACRCTHHGVFPISEYVAKMSRPHETLPGKKKSRVWNNLDGTNSGTKKRQAQYTSWVWNLSSQVGVSYCLFGGSHGLVGPKKTAAWWKIPRHIYRSKFICPRKIKKYNQTLNLKCREVDLYE